MVTQTCHLLKLEPCMVIPQKASDYKTSENMLKKTQEYQQLQHFILQGFPAHQSQLPEPRRQFWHICEYLSLDDELIVYGCRLLIPCKLCQQVLTQLHKSHQGTVRTKQRAHLSIYWPGIDNDIDNIILECQTCQDCLPSNVKEPLIQQPRPDRPFQEITIDFCSYAGRDYLIIVDCFTGWPAVISMDHGTTTLQLIKTLRESFCRTAIPDIVWSDGGT